MDGIVWEENWDGKGLEAPDHLIPCDGNSEEEDEVDMDQAEVW